MRWIIRIAVTLVVLILLGVGALFLIPTAQVARLAADQFEKSTGRALVISGEVSPSFWPVLGVKTGPVSIANADWAAGEPLLEAKALSIGVDAMALFGGTVKITEVVADAPQIRLERNAAGIGNWEFGKAGGTGAGGAEGADSKETAGFSLDKGLIRGGSVSFVDAAAGLNIAVTGLEAELSLPEYQGAAKLRASGQLRGQELRLDATVAEFAALMAGKMTALDMTAQAGGAEAAFKGRAGLSPLMAEGQLAANLGDMAEVSALAAMTRPDLPQGFGAGKVALEGQVTLTPEGTAHLRKGTITLDGNSLNGDVDYLLGEARPKITARFQAGMLDFSGLSSGGGSSTGQASGASGGGWSKDGIDISALQALDGSIGLTAKGINLGGLTLGPTQALVTIDRGRAVIDLKKVTAYDGTVTGQVVLNGRDGLSMRADLAAQGVAMEPLLAQAAGFDRLIAQGDAQFNVLGSGNSVAALMSSLSGKGKLVLGKGEIRGLDIAGMITNLDPGFVGDGAKTIFDGLSASFTVEKGVLVSDDLVMTAPVLTVTGKGRANLGKQSLNYRLVPKAFAGADGKGGLKAPLVISGPWSNLSYKLDIKAMTGVDVDKEVKDRVAKAAEEKLGVKRKKGESLEDAAKRRAQEALEKEAGKALGGLLGGN